jgi:hypothetical protein
MLLSFRSERADVKNIRASRTLPGLPGAGLDRARSEHCLARGMALAGPLETLAGSRGHASSVDCLRGLFQGSRNPQPARNPATAAQPEVASHRVIVPLSLASDSVVDRPRPPATDRFRPTPARSQAGWLPTATTTFSLPPSQKNLAGVAFCCTVCKTVPTRSHHSAGMVSVGALGSSLGPWT